MRNLIRFIHLNSQIREAGFTLAEIIMVVIILGVIASFGLVRFTGAVSEAREQEAVNQLRAIHAANEIYIQRDTSNPPGYLPGANLDVTAINNGLGLSIFSNSITYRYTRTGVNSYTAVANCPGGFSVSINEAPLGAGNPWCSGGSCPTVP